MALRSFLFRAAVLLALVGGAAGRSSAQDQPAPAEPAEPGPGFRCVAFSPDGKLLAAGAGEPKEKGWVCLWETGSRKLLFAHRKPAGAPSVAFSPDGATLAVVVYDQPVKLLDVRTGATRATFKGHEKTPRCVAFSPDSKTLATGSYDHTIKLWDLATGKEKITLKGHTGWVYQVVFSPDGKRLASVAADNSVWLWDVAGEQGHALGKHDSLAKAAVFSSDGRLLLTGGWDGEIRLWDLPTGTQRLRLENRGGVDGLAFAPAAQTLAVCGHGRKIGLYDLSFQEPAEKELARIRGLVAKWEDDSYEVREAASRDLRAIGFPAEPELRRVMKESPSAEVRIRARRLRMEILSQPRASLAGHTGDVEGVAFAPDGKLLASGGKDGTVRLWDVAARKELARLVPEERAAPKP